MFAFGCPLEFIISEQLGSNVTYDIDFGDEVISGLPRPIMSTKLTSSTHTFQPAKENSRILTFKASNAVSKRIKDVTLKFMPRISGIVVGNSGPAKTGIQMTFNLTVQEKGLESCFIVTTEKGLSESNTMQVSQFWLGDSMFCKTQRKYKGMPARPDLNPTSAEWTDIFNQVGEFKVTVEGENSVSQESGTTTVTVLDKPCYLPKLSWINLNEEKNNPVNHTKSKR